MQDYLELCRELITDHVDDCLSFDKTETRKSVLEELREDTQDVFGNLTGSRTCNTYEAQQFIDKSGALWDDEIHDLFNDISDSYFSECVKQGAETFDVVVLELLASRVIHEMLDEEPVV